MPSSPPQKRHYLLYSLMTIVLLGLIWYAGMLFQDAPSTDEETGRKSSKTLAMKPGSVAVTKKISTPASREAADGRPLTGIRKKLPPQPVKSEPEQAPPTSAPISTSVEQEKPQEPQPPPAPPVAMALPASEASREVPEKPPERPDQAQPASAPSPAISDKPASPKPPEPIKSIAKKEKSLSATYPFSLLLCSHRIQKNALSIQTDFERKGLAPYIVFTDLGDKGKWWRTLLGHYKTHKEALKAIKKLNLGDEVMPVKTPFANLLGDYPSEKDAAGAAARFAQKGLFAYVTKGVGDDARLLVGAFPSQAAAEQQQRELEGMGIIAHAIQR